MTVAEFTPRLRNRIAMAIQESGLSQKEVAARMGVSPQVISAWVRGNREPSPSALLELARVTDAPWLPDLRGLAEQASSSSGWMYELPDENALLLPAA